MVVFVAWPIFLVYWAFVTIFYLLKWGIILTLKVCLLAAALAGALVSLALSRRAGRLSG